MPSPPEITTRPERAAEVLVDGGLVAIPTETVYGLAALADHDEAIARLYRVKGRPTDHPLIVHLRDIEELGHWAATVPDAAALLATWCWPGPLSVVVPAASHVSRRVTAGLDTVALRVPAHPLALALLDLLPSGLAAPSANRFGRVSPTTAAHVVADLGDDVDLVLDGGRCAVGVESTIVDCTVDPPQVLRPGGVPVEDVERILAGAVAPTTGTPRAPGMLPSHYSPVCRVIPVESADDAARTVRSLRDVGRMVDLLDPGDDLVAYAYGLYGWLRDADDRGLDDLIVVLPAAEGLGHAVRDRVQRAGHQ